MNGLYLFYIDIQYLMSLITNRYPLVTWSETPILRTKCSPVKEVNKEIKQFAKDLLVLMKEYNWVWIAAPQVWVDARMAAFSQLSIEKKDRDVISEDVMINPEVLYASDILETDEEWCLSLPRVQGTVARPNEITVSYTNMKGKKVLLKAEGYNARIILHEIDHLDGVLFIDRLV